MKRINFTRDICPCQSYRDTMHILMRDPASAVVYHRKDISLSPSLLVLLERTRFMHNEILAIEELLR